MLAVLTETILTDVDDLEKLQNLPELIVSACT